MMAPRRALLALLGCCGGLLRGATGGKVLTGADMRAMGMGELAGVADGDMSPDSIAALQRHGVKDTALQGMRASGGGSASAQPSGVSGSEFTPHGGGTSAMSMASLSEEESVGSAIPASMRCDACHAIAHQLTEAMAHAQGRSTLALPEGKVIDVLEAVCEGKLRPKQLGTGENYRVVEQHWGEYCIKEIGGENRMAGPGCPIEDQSGYAQFGMMKTRLEKKCFEVLGEHDEAEIYSWYRRHKMGNDEGAQASSAAHLRDMVCQAECKSTQLPKKKPATEKRAKKVKGKRHKADKADGAERLEPGRAGVTTQRQPDSSNGGVTDSGSVDAAQETGGDLERLQTELERIREMRAQLYEEETKIFEQLRSLMVRMTP
jgi:hypothetical protein